MKRLIVRSNLVWIPILVQVLFLLPAITATRDILDVDAVVYSRIASYYLNGQLDLAINGYFGPLLSWIMIPFLWWSGDPVSSYIMAMAVSAVVFQVGSILFLRAADLADWQIIIGGVMSGLFATSWSVMSIAPDLLAVGLFLGGLSFVLDDEHPTRFRKTAFATLFLGAACLAKAVMVPTSIASVATIYGLRWMSGTLPWRAGLRRGLLIAGLMVGFLSPWIATVSFHYGKPVISTSAAINHAILRFKDDKRDHIFVRTYHKPEAGRITAWEDPSGEHYQYWSPFESMDNFYLQLGFTAGNVVTIVQGLTHLGTFGIGLILALFASACIFWLLLYCRQHTFFARNRWLLSGPLIIAASAVYLPVFSAAQRYYLVTYPMMLSLAFPVFQLAFKKFLAIANFEPSSKVATPVIAEKNVPGSGEGVMSRAQPGKQKTLSETIRDPVVILTSGLVLVFFSIPYVVFAPVAFRHPLVYTYNTTAREIVTVLGDKAPGALASAGDIDHATVIASFLSGRQYFGGRMDNPKLDAMLASGARYLVVEPGSEPDKALGSSSKAREIAARISQPAPPQRMNHYRIYQVTETP